jgi:hypothetical protein
MEKRSRLDAEGWTNDLKLLRDRVGVSMNTSAPLHICITITYILPCHDHDHMVPPIYLINTNMVWYDTVP